MVVTRVGQPEPGASDTDFYADLDKAKKRHGCFSCGGCISLFFLIALLLVLGAASLVAASGIASVPVLSSILYKTDPLPTRVVEASAATDIGALIESKLKAAAGDAFEVSESELTAALREPTASGKVELKRGQVAISSEKAEIYGQVSPGEYGQPVVLRAELSPAADNQLELTRVRIGYVDIPIKIARYLGGVIVGQDIGSTAALSRYGVTELTLSAGSVLITIDPTSFIQGNASIDESAVGLLRKAGIDPAVLSSGQLSPEMLAALEEKLSAFSPSDLVQLQSDIPQLKRLDR